MNLQRQPHETAFIETFADHWSAGGASRIEGLIAGYLLVDNEGGVSAAELSEQLSISSGSVSTYTRQLIERGFVHRVRKPGIRAHFFMMSSDVWADFIQAEQTYLEKQRSLAESALPLFAPGSPAWGRIQNMRDYMGWLVALQLPRGWQEFKRARDAAEQ
ncbi:GbsR/MarR family transcriptional regulator [Leucobacter chinensis]|uniref:GbsR/MarR family transcriptional regulator n=1 Tax=Leucobacter chinensis TaxID=2851010 RepID=UPI001C2142CE|nr:MarR family transcriptional regulator [Leucobacter chinensis]